ncbi:MAG TPA: CBS domain-containing protein [Coleofasciculaceae cyanobacterium]|jgi:CBS domain-containing protein
MPKAQDIMTQNPMTCREQDPIRRAVEVMKQQNTGVVPIVGGNDQPVGIVTDRDICLDVILNNMDPTSTPVGKIMHKNLLTCSPQDDLNQVIRQMEQRQVKRILVVENQRLIGIISEHDIVSHVSQQQAGELASGVFR